MSQNIPLISAFCIFVGLVGGYAVNMFLTRRRLKEEEKTFFDIQNRAIALQQESLAHQNRAVELQERSNVLQIEKDRLVETLAQVQAQTSVLEAQRVELKEQNDTKTSRLRDAELELERLKLLDSSRNETETKLRSLEIEKTSVTDKYQEATAQAQLLDARLADSYVTQQKQQADLERRLMERETEVKNRDQRILEQQREVTELRNKRTAEIESYQKEVSSLVQAQDDLTRQKEQIRIADETRRLEQFEKRKLNWVSHENAMVEQLKNLCKRMEIVYHTQKTFPLLRKPDFAIEVAGQYVVFDAKAPADPEHPENFYDYLKRQAEGLEKYLKQEGVRKEGFLVVPTDALPFLQERFYFEVGAYKIYVVGVESLEPALRLLLKIEEYEILQALGPEAQDEIATFIGQASRMIKRRVQIDHFMSDKFIELLISGESLPEEIQKKAQTKEKNFHLNPPKLDRGKPLHKEDLAKRQDQLSFHIERMDINATEGRETLEQIPLERIQAPTGDDEGGQKTGT